MIEINLDIYSLILLYLNSFECSIFSITSKDCLKLVKTKYHNIYHIANILNIFPSKIFNMIHKSEFSLKSFYILLSNDISQNVVYQLSETNPNEKINYTIELFKIATMLASSSRIENHIKYNLCSYFEKLYIKKHSKIYYNNNLIIYIYSLRVTNSYWNKSNINIFFLMENMLLLLRNEYEHVQLSNFDYWFDNNIQNTICTFNYMIQIMNSTHNMVIKLYSIMILYQYIIYIIKNKYYNDDIYSNCSINSFIHRIPLLKNTINVSNSLHFKTQILETFDTFCEIYKMHFDENKCIYLNMI